MADTPPMERWRGAVLVCDHVYQDRSNKWIIAGTYSCWTTSDQVLAVQQGVNVYIRILPEATGKVAADLQLIDADQLTAAPILRLDIAIDIASLQPVEIGLATPPLTIPRPNGPDGRPLAQATRNFRFWLRVAGTDVASSPLQVIFTPPGATPQRH